MTVHAPKRRKHLKGLALDKEIYTFLSSHNVSCKMYKKNIKKEEEEEEEKVNRFRLKCPVYNFCREKRVPQSF